MKPAEALDASSTALVPADDHNVTDAKKLTVVEAAQVAQVSPSTVLRAIRKGILPAKKRGKTFVMMRDIVVQVAPQLRERAPARHVQEAQREGEQAAKVFRAFADSTPLEDIVMTLGVAPAVVLELFAQWEKLRTITGKWLGATPNGAALALPKFDHEAQERPDGSWCCPGHKMQREMKENAKR